MELCVAKVAIDHGGHDDHDVHDAFVVDVVGGDDGAKGVVAHVLSR